MKTYDKFYIGGSWVKPVGRDRLDVIASTTEEVFATIPAGLTADINRAVTAARAAFPAWSAEPAPQRGKLLRRVAEELEARSDEIASVIAHEVGMPLAQSAAIQVGTGIAAFSTASELASTFAFEDDTDGLVVKEPIGVVGCITPWNYPLNQIGAKVAYALAAGCTVVLKPSEVAPVNAYILAEIIDGIGFPAGVFNLSPAKARSSVKRSPRIPTSTWSRSPDRHGPGGASRSSRRRRSNGSRWSSAASRPTCSSRMPTSRRR